MTDFSKILDKAKELEAKMKESQEKIKQIEVVGSSGGDAIKVTLNGDGEMTNIEIGDEILKLNNQKLAIKIDVERHELSVLKGFVNLLNNNVKKTKLG